MPATETPLTPSATRTFRDLPFMGVIHVNNEAAKVGYKMGDPSWSNLGQGQPEVGEMPGAPPRFSELKIDLADHAYGPVEGLPQLREAVANHYNRLYRKGKSSQYTAENVAVSAGGRLALSRCAAALDINRLGYFTPDYTAYEDLLTTFSRIEPAWIQLKAENAFRIDADELAHRVKGDAISTLLISNPCNPTGVVIEGDDLATWPQLARDRRTTVLMDEFYSHFTYNHGNRPVSSAEFIEDVNDDPVVIFDGLTKCFRYPGWRIGWVVAPKDIIYTMTAAGSFLDGGPSRPMQHAALAVLEQKRADQETNALRAHFGKKQKLTLDTLKSLGVEFPGNPQGTFYVWGDVSKLPKPLNTGQGFMREAFKHRVLTVPGEFFDVNPARRRTGASYLTSFVRFSFGPPMDNLQAGLARLKEMVGKVR